MREFLAAHKIQQSQVPGRAEGREGKRRLVRPPAFLATFAAASGVRFMADQRPLRLDLFASGLLLAGLLVGLSVFSHVPAGDSTALSYPPPKTSSNLLGPPGGWVAQGLHDTFGLAVYVFLASWFVLVLLLMLRGSWATWTRRLAGWL